MAGPWYVRIQEVKPLKNFGLFTSGGQTNRKNIENKHIRNIVT